MNDKTVVISCFILAVMISFTKGQCSTPPALSNGAYSSIITGKIVAYYCNPTFTFSTSDTVITSDCVGTAWTAINVQCASSGPATTCPSDNPNPPNNATEVPVTEATSNLMKVYECQNDLQWLSGEPVRISQCSNGTWTTILDICDIACPIPRHCADVSALGLSGTGDFYVIPSGKPYGQVFLVHCELNSTSDNNGGNWTYIFKTDQADFSNSPNDYLNGIGIINYTSAPHYFIGLYYLSNVSLPLPGDTIGMTLEVLFYDSSQKLVSYATYNNFTVGDVSTSYSINSLGKYHGIAGDALCPHLGTQFNFGTPTSQTSAAYWWRALYSEIATVAGYNGSFLTSKATWTSLNTTIKDSVSTVVMRIRPTVDDNDVVCPPMVGTEYWWQSTRASIPYSRTPGTNITWQCFGEYIMEGVEGGNRTYDGISTCLNTTTPPQWSYDITLPCTLTCPDGFVESDDARVCFNYSTDTAVSIMDAAMKCSAKGAYLSVIVNETDFSPSDNRTGYYTAFAARGSNASQLVPPLPATVLDNCTTTTTSACKPNITNQCTVIQAPDQYKHVSCLETHNYLCQLQRYCPNSTYHPIGGRCLKIFSGPTSLAAASMACAAEGASLVYPTTIAEAGNITSFLLQNGSSAAGTQKSNSIGTPMSYFIGTNNFNDDWTAGGLFVMGDLQPHLATDPINSWRTMTVYPNSTFSFTPIDINAVIPNTKAVCSLFGPLGCSGYCPAQAANMYIVNASGNATALGSTVSYKCYPGYFFENITIDVLNSTCNGLLGGASGWVPSTMTDCIPLEVCDNSTLTVGSTLLSNNSVDPDSFYLNGTTTFTCPPNMGYITNTTSMNTTCQGNTTAGYVFNPAVIPACNVCLADITVANATTNWTSTSGSFVTINQSVSATCDAGYEVTFGVTVQNISCTEVGWNLTNIVNCSLACVNPPPAINTTDNVTAPNVTDNKIGTVLTYNCTAGYSFLVSTNFTAVTNQATATCNASGAWVPSRTPLQCNQLCASDPPPAPVGATSDWDNFSRSSSQKVVYTATNGTLFGNFSNTWTIICNGSAWLPIDNSSTSPTGNGQMFAVKRACIQDPPNTIGGALPVNWTSTAKAFTGHILSYACPDGQYTTTGSNSTTITCSNATSNWTVPSTDFHCKNACQGAPPPAVAPATYNYVGNFTEGVVVTYKCVGGFSGGLGTVLTNNCTDGNWTIYTVPKCLTITTPGPTTLKPVILPESNVSYLYPDTTSNYYGDLTTFNSTSGAATDYTTVNGVIGFGSAVALNKSLNQCLKKSPFATNQSCLSNPDQCAATGLSFSLWTLVLYDDSVYNMTGLSDADNQYMVSTGADKDGHPGVAIGIRKQWLFALVSTGSQYWYTEILGQLQNNTWNNVGVRFSQALGLEVYVNCTKVGSTTIIYTATAKPGYSPPTILIGCQRTASDSNFTGYFNGYCDEVAIWNKLVPVTNNLSLNFFGGYSANTSNISPTEFASMLANIQINNPGQQAAAVKILSQLTASSPDPTPAPTATQTNAVSGSVASPTSAGSTAEAVTTPAPANVKSLKTIGTILMDMMDPTRLPTTLTPDQADTFLKLSESFSNVLGPDNSANWKVVQNQTETVGVMQLVQQFRAWHSKLMQSITYTNESKPMCNEVVNKNLYIKYCKMTICDFGEMGKRYTVPDYSKPSLEKIRGLWKEIVTDRIAFPTQIFPDDRCCDRPVSFIFHYYGFADQAAVSTVNPMFVGSNAYTSIDARIMNLDIVSDLPYDSMGNVDTHEPLCNFDAEALRDQQLLFKSSHMDTNDAMITPRKLLLFENQTVTDVQERRCVYWNENLTDYGAWDCPHCTMAVDTGEDSKCACSNVGIFTIIAVKSEPIVVPTQAKWVYLIKYIFYGLSCFAVIVYITVVMMSGELKDQFHLAGLHLAIAILIGSIAMVISDFAAVKDDRNTCTMVGTFIHIFYGAVGTWILCLGHAAFNAITSGIIGGRLLSYSTIAWGIPLAFAGVPFITMLSLMGYDPYCFIGWDNIVKYVFFAPQMACALIASFFAIVILCNLSTPALRKENLIKDYGTFCRGAALLILYLSITWTFGLVTYIRFGIAPDFYPIFQVLNSLSGVCLLVLIGFGSERFRSTLAGKTQARREMLRQFAFGLPNSDDIQGPKKWHSNNPSAASTSTLIPDESNIPSEELQAY